MDKESTKTLPLPLDLATVSSSGHASDENQLGHWWIRAGVPVRCTNAEH
jgi:hypothetical protein